jgi:hypothetical protein
MPSIMIDRQNHPCFLFVTSGERPDDCWFWFIKYENDGWGRYRITKTQDTWNGGHLEYTENGGITAFLIARPPQYGNLPYGGGVLQEWHSKDKGQSWTMVQEISPDPGFLCNNPKAVEDLHGSPLLKTLLFCGWRGPDGILPNGEFKGQAYLWQDGNWL